MKTFKIQRKVRRTIKICAAVAMLFAACSQERLAAQVSTGLDVLIAKNFEHLKGKRVGLVTNQTAVSKGGRTAIDAFRQASQVRLVALYGPEHGLDGKTPAGEYVATRKYKKTGLPVYSLYGSTRKPTQEMLKGLDALVYDIQDIGCRSYTFISTMGLAMQAAAEAGIDFYVLDRPNPLGGLRIEGPPLDPEYRSFVGQYEIPYVYGLTPGELALLINHSKWMGGKPVSLHVVPMNGWTRNMVWEATGLRWVAPSPNIPTPMSARYYVATGWMGESGGMSNGVGGNEPFAVVGGSGISPERYADALNKLKLSGVSFQETVYRITQGKFKGGTVPSVRIIFTDLEKANLTNLSPHLMSVWQKQSGLGLFRKSTAEKICMFNKVTGGTAVKRWLASGKSVESLIASWQPSITRFREERKAVLLYP